MAALIVLRPSLDVKSLDVKSLDLKSLDVRSLGVKSLDEKSLELMVCAIAPATFDFG